MPPIAPPVQVRPLAESRPPSNSWRPAESSLIAANQPPLDLTPPGDVDLGRPSGAAATLTLVRAKWTVRPRPDLPDARQWGAALTLAVLQALLAQRPIAQLNRWLAEDVLSTVSMQQRRRQTAANPAVRPVLVRSLRVQHPGAEVAEVSAHVLVGSHDSALAFRLEALGERWLCTALELDPQVLR